MKYMIPRAPILRQHAPLQSYHNTELHTCIIDILALDHGNVSQYNQSHIIVRAFEIRSVAFFLHK